MDVFRHGAGTMAWLVRSGLSPPVVFVAVAGGLADQPIGHPSLRAVERG